MKNISKLLVGILFSALAIAPSYAGELAVSGGATATYVTNGNDASAGKNIGISNELDFSASGELDNGYTWNYQVQLDGATSANDDTRLEVGTDYGTIGLYVSEGGLSKELQTGAGALGVGFDYISPATFQAGYDVDGYSNIQYHLPADLLPLGLGVKVGYVPNMRSTAMLSAKDSTETITNENTGRTLTQIQITAAPIDGLSIGGDAAETSDETGNARLAGGGDQGVSANLGAKYTMGQFTVGYTMGGYQPAVDTGVTAYYENEFMGVQFDLNDSISVSYNQDKSEKKSRASSIVAGASGAVQSVVEMEQKSYQLAYTTGGATIGIAQVEVANADYTSGQEEEQSVISLAISF
jgi:hypothetical protein